MKQIEKKQLYYSSQSFGGGGHGGGFGGSAAQANAGSQSFGFGGWTFQDMTIDLDVIGSNLTIKIQWEI